MCTSCGAGAEHHTPPGLFCACGASITPDMGWAASFWRGLGSPGSLLGTWDLPTQQRVNEFGGFSPPTSFGVCSTWGWCVGKASLLLRQEVPNGEVSGSLVSGNYFLQLHPDISACMSLADLPKPSREQ